MNRFEEKSEIEGHKYIGDPISLELQMLVKSGNEFKINPDQIRQWENAGSEFAERCWV